MEYKSILVPALNETSFPGGMRAAISIAKEFESHLVACQARQPFDLYVKPLPYPLEMNSVSHARKSYEEAEDAMARKLRFQFETEIRRSGVQEFLVDDESIPDHNTATWTLGSGDPLNVFARRGALSDLIVLQCIKGPGFGNELELREGLLTRISRPLLLVPEEGMTSVPKSVVIGYNGSSEAIRAISYAMPFIANAEEVTLLTIGDLNPDRPGFEELVRYLKFHGIKSKVVEVAQDRGRVSQQIDSVLSNLGADLFVMGGYSHSRLREIVFGGVTAKMMRNPTIPVFMIH